MKSFLFSNRFLSLLIIAGAILVAGFILVRPAATHASGGAYFCGYIGGMNGSTIIYGVPPSFPIADPRCAPTIAIQYTGDYPGPGTYGPEVTAVNCVYLGPLIGGYFCDVTEQFPGSCDINAGKACSGPANSCGQSNIGTLGCDGITCDAGGPPAAIDQCPNPVTDPGLQCSLSQCSKACVPDTSCAAVTPLGQTCSDGCGGLVAGTKPVGCGAPSVTMTAAPTRVTSGGTAHLTVLGNGITTSCQVTGPGVNKNLPAATCTTGAADILTPALTTQSTYTVSCDSGAATAKVIINVNPTFKPF